MRPSRLALAIAALVLWAGAIGSPRALPRRDGGRLDGEVDARLVAVRVAAALPALRVHAPVDAAPPPSHALLARGVASPARDRVVARIALADPALRSSLRLAHRPGAPRGPPRSMT
jgi:hypothetical protein